MEENIITEENYCDQRSQSDVHENFEREIEFIIKSNEYLAQNKIKTKTEQLLL